MGPGSAGRLSLWAVSILGGTPRRLHEDVTRAAVAPDSAHIAFITNRDGEIWIMGANGEDARKLAEADAGYRFVDINWQNSQRVAYMKRRDTNAANVIIEVRELNGTRPHVVLADPRLMNFCWLPDGRIIYSRAEPPPNEKYSNLWELPVDAHSGQATGESRRITNWPGFSFWDLTATADAKRLVFVKYELQNTVFTAELKNKGKAMGQPRRLTLDERNDLPSAWTPDSSSVFFYSDRNGNWDLFRQSPQRRPVAEDFVVGGEAHLAPKLTPDGASVLYWSYPRGETDPRMRLMRIPVVGGPQEPVLEAPWGAHFRCPSRPSAKCVLSEPDPEHKRLTFLAFDPAEGKKSELLRLDTDPGNTPAWDLAATGTKFAVVDFDARKDALRIVELPGGASHDLTVAGTIRLTGVAWSADASSIFVSSLTPTGAAISRLELDGQGQELWTTTTSLAAPVASPDGKKLAFALAIQNSNVWMIERF